MNFENLKLVKNKISQFLKNIKEEVVIRQSKITVQNILFGSLYKCMSNKSYDDVVSILNINNMDKNIIFTKSAFIIKKNKINSSNFLNLNNYLINIIYKNNKPRLIGVDGSSLDLYKNFKTYGYRYASAKETYCKGYLSCLFDIENKIPINYNLSKNIDERESLINQLKYVNKDDILIMDRGYYSDKLLKILNNLGINYIFRLKTNLNIVKNLENNDYTFTEDNIEKRVIKYRIKDKDYYLLTNLFNKTLKELKENYWSRWEIEINFKKTKYNLSLNNIKSKNENSLKQEIYINNLAFILYYFLKIDKIVIDKDIDKDNKEKEKYKINDKTGIYIFIEKISYIIINTRLTLNKYNLINKYLDIIKNNRFYIQKNRNFKRQSVIKKSLWYFKSESNNSFIYKPNKERKSLKNLIIL
jgi:hypothetical protein